MQPSKNRAGYATLLSVVALLSGVALARCFNPDLTNVTVTCIDSPACPAAMHCASGVCIPDEVSDAGITQSDGAADGAMPLVDMAVPGCKKGGTQIGTSWACPGVFKKGDASKLCATGFSVCQDATGVDTVACNALDGFFASQALGKSSFTICRNIDPVNYTCGPALPGFSYRMRFGCGNLAKTYLLKACQRQCGSFDRAFDCSMSIPDYYCSASNTIADDENTDPTIGVLCCPGP